MSEIKINNIPVITENNGSVELTTDTANIGNELTTDTANIGNNALVVNASGNVGIGTSSPAAGLHILSNGEKGYFISEAAIGGGWITIGGNFSDPAIGYISTGALRFGTTTDNVLGGFDERMRINSSGYVTKPYQPAFEARTYDDGTNAGYYPGSGQVEVATPYVNVTNIGNHFDLQNNRFTAPISGMYVIGFNFYFTPASGNYIGGVINISTGRYVYAFSSPGTDVNATYSTCIYLTQNDWVRFLTYCNDANSRLYNSSTVYGYFLG